MSAMEMLQSAAPWVADALVVLGVTIMTIGVYGVIRMPDIYTKLHAASKAVFLGVISLILASTVTAEREIVMRLVLIALALLLTTPVSSHVISRAAYLEGERMQTPGAIDESGHHLAPQADQG
jgi:multicomponent Na+:H+ antiporter subunit G